MSTHASYAEWERERARTRRTRSIDDDAAVPPPYSKGPPRYTSRERLPTNEATSVSQARFPRDLPARGDDGPRYTMSMGEVRRWDGRRACRVGSDGRCECGKVVVPRRGVSPGAPEGETADARSERKRKEMWNMKGKNFWGVMGMSFARAFMI